MGIVQRQGIKQSIITYLGIAFGAVNVLFIYPKVLTDDQWGFIVVLTSAAKLLLPFVLMGSLYMIVRFFPDFKNEKNGHNGYLPFILLWAVLGFLIFATLFLFGKEQIFDWFKADRAFVAKYGIYLLPILFFLAISTVLTKYISNFHRIAIPAIFNDLFLKIGMPLLCGLLWFEIIDFTNLIQGLTVIYILITICLFFYTQNLGQLFLKPNFKKFDFEKIKSISSYAGYGFLGSLGSAIIPFIDSLMVGAMVGLPSAAIYTIPNFIANAIDAPRRALSNITSPLLAESWKKENLAHIKELYQKTSLNQLIIGIFLLLLVWTSIDQLYALMPEGPKKETYESGKYVVLILGLSKVIDMLTGVNSEIIGYSKYFRFNFYAILILTLFAILMNYLLIPEFGIEGAALATMLSFGIFNLSKFLFLWFKLKLQPFTWNTLWTILLGIIIYLLTLLLPITDWTVVNIVLNSVFIALSFGGAILYLKLSPDINDIVNKGVEMAKGYLK